MCEYYIVFDPKYRMKIIFETVMSWQGWIDLKKINKSVFLIQTSTVIIKLETRDNIIYEAFGAIHK